MKIIYLHQYFTTPSMPGGTRSYEMARRLVRAGHEVHVITSDQASTDPAWRVTDEAGVSVHWTGVPYANAMSYARRIGAFVQFAMKSAARAAGLKGDVIFASSTPLTIALPAIYAARACRVPMVFEVRDLWPEKPIAMGVLRNPVLIALASLLEWLAYHAARHIVVLSPAAAGGVVNRGIRPRRISIIPNACDLEFDVPASQGEPVRARLGIPSDRPLIVYTGAFGRVNGVGYLAELAAQPAASGLTFLLVGSGAELAEVTALAGARGVLGKNLFIWEPVPKQDMPAVLAAAAIATSLVIPTPELWDNSANKFFDALAAGKPIAINYEGWQADLLRGSGAGIVLPPNDPRRAAWMLSEFAHNAARLAAASDAARKLAREKFDRDHLASRLEAVLRRAVETSS